MATHIHKTTCQPDAFEEKITRKRSKSLNESMYRNYFNSIPKLVSRTN